MVKIKNFKNPIKLQSQLKELFKIRIVNKKLHEIKNKILRDYIGEFEMVGKLSIVDQTRGTHIRFKNMDDLESRINAIDQD